MRIRDIEKSLNRDVQTIEPDRTVHDAIGQLVEHNIGALPVVESDGRLVGIFTRTDLARLQKRCDRGSDAG